MMTKPTKVTKMTKMTRFKYVVKLLNLMQPGVTPMIKERVIEGWFKGLKRDNIANKQGIATGTVTNIIREWVADFELGDVADAMRYFAVTFRNLKLTIPQCVLGARNVSMMKNLGIEENDFEEFISGTYKFLKELGVDPKKMADCIKQMEDLNATMPIAQIPQYISELEAEKNRISEDIDKLKTDELKLKTNIYKSLDRGGEYQQFIDLKLELKKYGLDMSHLSSFTKMIKQAHELGYDAHLIGSKIAYLDNLYKEENELEESVRDLKREKELLEHKRNPSQSAAKYLDSIGYPISET
jgi:hypothetical protein